MGSEYSCAHHPSQEAVAQCESCYKPICQECYDVFRIDKGIHAGGCVCYDCATELITSNTANINRFREQVKKERTKLTLGMVVAGIVAVMIGVGTESPAGFITVMLIYLAIYGIRFASRANQIRQCDEIIASDANALREMREYFAYTQIMEEQRGRASFENLVSQGGALFNNSYARTVASSGEAAAQAGLRQSVVTISANGEIIRSFAGARG